MTHKKSKYRKRRQGTTTVIPTSIKQWFAGEIEFTFYAHTPPYMGLLQEYRTAWLELHPDAVKPEGLDKLIDLGRSYKRLSERQRNENP